MNAKFIHKRREYLGQVPGYGGFVHTYSPWQTVAAFDQGPRAKDSIAAQPKVGMWQHAIFHRGKILA
jgi:hypothetical protein